MGKGRKRKWEHPILVPTAIGLSYREKDKIKKLAQKAGLTVSMYLRSQLQHILIEGVEEAEEK